MARKTVICRNCRRRVFRVANPGPSGAWYHNHNGSVSCRPGEGSDRRAIPIEVQVRERPAATIDAILGA